MIDAIPSQVLVHVLTTLGVAGGSTAWGIAYLKEPDGKGVNPQYVTIFDTLPDIQGYNHRDGEPIQHYTVQIRIREDGGDRRGRPAQRHPVRARQRDDIVRR